jgi:ADP-heptose:LPS heptosyltransferase
LTLLSKGLKSTYLLAGTLSAMTSALFRSDKFTKLLVAPQKILIFGYMGLGDALMFQPSLRSLLRAYPNTTFDLIVGLESQSRTMLERGMSLENRIFNEIFEADYKSLSISQLRNLNTRLVQNGYDAVISTYMSPAPYFLSTILHSPIRVGHRLPWSNWYKPRPNNIFNVAVDLAQDHEHETSRHWRLIKELLPADAKFLSPTIQLTETERDFADTFWHEHSLQNEIVIGTHFGASKGQNWKKWDDDRFAEVMKDLAERCNPVFLHFGTGSERDQIREASKFVAARSIDLTGALTIFEVAALLSKCSIMLGNDSGLGHVAMAVGTRSVRIFGMSDYWGYRSLSPEHVDVFKGISCSPCLQLGYLKPYNVHNCGHKNCLKLIQPSEIVDLTVPLLI